MENYEFDFLINSVSLAEVSKSLGVFLSSKKNAASDLHNATGIPLDEARQKLVSACLEVAVPSAVLDSHAHLGKIPGNKLETLLNRNIKGGQKFQFLTTWLLGCQFRTFFSTIFSQVAVSYLETSTFMTREPLKPKRKTGTLSTVLGFIQSLHVTCSVST